jgi:hypothetical protein
MRARAISGREYCLDRHADADAVQLGDNLLGAPATKAAEDFQTLLERIHIANVQSEKMHLVLPEVHAELNAGNEAQSARVRGDLRLGDSRQGVVVGEGEGGEARGMRGRDGGRRTQRTVRRRRVRVQVDVGHRG